MKSILILGGGKGVGKEILKSCLGKGYKVAFCGRSAEQAGDLIKEHEDSGNLYYHQLDLRDIEEVTKFYEETIKRYKKVDAAIIYAGVTPVGSILDSNEATYDSIFDINLKAPFFLLQKVLKGMIDNKSGSIIFFGSAHMDYGEINRAPYALSKSALYTLSSHIAHHYAKYGIRSNYVVMGWTATEGELELRRQEGISEDELKKKAAEIIPMGRMLSNYDPVPAVMYLVSDDSGMTTGSLIRITGGEFI